MSNPMRAAVDVTPLLGARTGIGELVAGLVGALRERDDVEVVPIALTWRGRRGAGAHHRPIPARLIQGVWSRLDLFPITRWSGQVDVVHGTNYVVGPPSSGPRPAPRIVTVHDLATVKTPELCHRDTLIFPHLVRRAVQSGAFVQTDTQTVADEVVDWLQIDRHRVRAIYPGVPTLGAGDVTGVDPRLSNRPFVLTLGTEEPRKGLLRVVSLLPSLLQARPDIVWAHAGGKGWGSDELTAALAQLAPEQRASVVRLGRVTDSQRAWLLRHAEVFLYPSLDEGFGFPPLEALSVGTSVVAHRLPVLREVLDATDAALVDTADPTVFLSAVLSRCRSERGLISGDTDKLPYSWQAMAASQVQFYRDVRL
jgi:glycosyltransferase involved in cell wall biosynthesis